MKRETVEEEKIHLSELDEYLASKIVETDTTLKFILSKPDLQGNFFIRIEDNNEPIEEGGIDFELSPSEYQSLNSTNVQEFTNQTIYTSSAYEFFDFMLTHYSYLEFLLDFNGSGWRIKVLNSIEDK